MLVTKNYQTEMTFINTNGNDLINIPSGPGLEYGQRILWPFSDCSLTIPWAHIIMAKNDKKHLKHCNYDSAIKFELAGVGIHTIILFFRDKN